MRARDDDALRRLGIVPVVCQVEHPEVGLLGFVVINSSVWRRAVGGVRLMPDVTVEQVADLARAMTYKFGFLKMPCGGAKAGLIASPTWYPGRSSEMLRYFGAAMGPWIRNRIYTPGPDMGVGARECWEIFNGAGLVEGHPPPEAEKDSDLTGTSGYPTGITVYLAAVNSLAALGKGPQGATVAIEGFGKVGAVAAGLFAEAGSRVVGVSTVNAAIYQPGGLDVDELLRLRQRFGDRAVEKYTGATVISHADLFELPVDVLCPCASQWSIHAGNVHKLRCRVLSSGANCTLHPDSRAALLTQSDVLVIPDFVANCGGVLGSNLHGRRRAYIRLLYDKYSRMIRELIEASQQLGVSIDRVARYVAEENIRSIQGDRRRAQREAMTLDLTARVSQNRYVPRLVADRMARSYVKKWIPRIPNSIPDEGSNTA